MESILTLKDAAALLKVSPSWLRRSACPRIAVSTKMVRYSREDTLEWFKAHGRPAVRALSRAG